MLKRGFVIASSACSDRVIQQQRGNHSGRIQANVPLSDDTRDGGLGRSLQHLENLDVAPEMASSQAYGADKFQVR
jgi:hypothetical protein